MSVLSDITGVIGLATKAMELADKTKNLDLKEVIVELKGKLIDLKEEILELREDNSRLTEELKQATEPPAVTLKDGHYHTETDGPFCTACYDTGRKLIRLIEGTLNDRRLLHVHRKCPACKTGYAR